jgi:hypothetical protein
MRLMRASMTLHVDASEVVAVVEEMAGLVETSPDWLRWLAAQAFENFQESVDLLRIDEKRRATSAAGDLRICAKPGEKLLLLLTALRAGNGQAGPGVGCEFHGGARA